MGLLDQITGALGQQTGGSGQSNQLMQLALNLTNSHPGGLQGLVQQFMQAGLGQQAQSWVSSGQSRSDFGARAAKGSSRRVYLERDQPLAACFDPAAGVDDRCRGHEREQKKRVSEACAPDTHVEVPERGTALQRPG